MAHRHRRHHDSTGTGRHLCLVSFHCKIDRYGRCLCILGQPDGLGILRGAVDVCDRDGPGRANLAAGRPASAISRGWCLTGRRLRAGRALRRQFLDTTALHRRGRRCGHRFCLRCPDFGVRQVVPGQEGHDHRACGRRLRLRRDDLGEARGLMVRWPAQHRECVRTAWRAERLRDLRHSARVSRGRGEFRHGQSS